MYFSKILLLGLPFWSILPAPVFAQSDGWVTLEDPDGGFMASFPAAPQLLRDSQRTDVGLLPYRLWYAQVKTVKGDSPYFAIHHWRYPSGIIPRDSVVWVNDLLEETIQASLANTGGELLYSSDIRLSDRYPGKLWRIDIPEKGWVTRSQAFFAADNFYLLQTVFSADAMDPHWLRRFFDDFALMGLPAD